MVRGTFPARLVLGLLLPLVAVIAATAGPLAAGSPAAGASQPTLPTTPVVNLKVGALPVSAYGAHYIAQERGYFRDVGLNVEFESGNSVNDLLPALAQGQIQVGGCSSNVFCFNFLNRRADLQIVADVQIVQIQLLHLTHRETATSICRYRFRCD